MIIKQVVRKTRPKKNGAGSGPDKEEVLSDSPRRSANASVGIAKPNLPTITAKLGLALQARCVLDPMPHQDRGDQAPLARSRFRGSRPLDPTALDGRRPEAAVPSGKSLRVVGSVQRASTSRLDESDRTRVWRGARSALAASTPGADCQCRTSSLRAAPAGPG